jgi:hypothetical protein
MWEAAMDKRGARAAPSADATTSLRAAQFGTDIATNHDVAIHFVAMANAVAGVAEVEKFYADQVI